MVEKEVGKSRWNTRPDQKAVHLYEHFANYMPQVHQLYFKAIGAIGKNGTNE